MNKTTTIDPNSMPTLAIPKLLVGQKALVTGANSGIGKAVALCLAETGAEVVVNYVRGEKAAAEVVNTIREDGGKAVALQADVSQETQVRQMFQAMFEEFGAIDILVNNAGLQMEAAFDQMTLQQ